MAKLSRPPAERTRIESRSHDRSSRGGGDSRVIVFRGLRARKFTIISKAAIREGYRVSRAERFCWMRRCKTTRRKTARSQGSSVGRSVAPAGCALRFTLSKPFPMECALSPCSLVCSGLISCRVSQSGPLTVNQVKRPSLSSAPWNYGKSRRRRRRLRRQADGGGGEGCKRGSHRDNYAA